MSAGYHTFLARLCDRGGYASMEHAEQVLLAALHVLASCLSAQTAAALADQLPAFLTEALDGRSKQEAERFSAEEFCRRMAQRNETSLKTARWDAEAVLTCLADSQSWDLTTRILHELPIDYLPLFGRPG